VVARISPMPSIRGIRARHSVANNLLYLYDFIVINLRENNAVIQVEVINRFITPEEVLIHMAPASLAEQMKTNLAEDVKGRTVIASKDVYAWLPVSLTALTTAERTAFCVLLL